MVTSTAKAVFFHCYGDKKASWFPLSTVHSRREDERGSVVIEIADWIHAKYLEKREDGDFQELTENPQPELPAVTPPIMQDGIIVDAQARKLCTEILLKPKHELRSNTALDLARILSCRLNDEDLLLLFDEAVALLHERGVDIPNHYKGEQ